MFQSIQSAMMRPFRRTNSQEGQQNQNNPHERNDRTEDGFLLVGQTASERTTVHTDGFRSDRINPPPGYSQWNDWTEDGFLLVGQTASERTTVHTDGFRSDRINPPPGYSQLNQTSDLPTYRDYNSNRSIYSPTIDVSNNANSYNQHNPQTPAPTWTQTPTIHTRTSSHLGQTEHSSLPDLTDSPITDVPFVMAGQLSNQKLVTDLRTSSLLLEKQFDWFNYEYDFSLEMTVLNELENRMDVN